MYDMYDIYIIHVLQSYSYFSKDVNIHRFNFHSSDYKIEISKVATEIVAKNNNNLCN